MERGVLSAECPEQFGSLYYLSWVEQLPLFIGNGRFANAIIQT